MRDLPPTIRLVLARELRAHRRSFLYWTLAVSLLLIMVISIQPSMAHKGSALEAKLAMLPDAVKRVFGLTGLDFTRPAGYLAVNFLYVTLTAPLSAAMLGATLVGKEEAQHTAEILFAQPVSRRRVLLGKAAALALHILAFHVILAAVTLIGFRLVVHGPIEAPLVLAQFGGTAVLAICFGGLGMLAATLVRRPRGAANAGLGIVLGGYLLSVVGAISPALEWVGWASPFHAVAPTRILAAGGLDPLAVAVLVAIGVAGAAAAVIRYDRRDILP
jgi:ABC-2 type transport system permease protein